MASAPRSPLHKLAAAALLFSPIGCMVAATVGVGALILTRDQPLVSGQNIPLPEEATLLFMFLVSASIMGQTVYCIVTMLKDTSRSVTARTMWLLGVFWFSWLIGPIFWFACVWRDPAPALLPNPHVNPQHAHVPT